MNGRRSNLSNAQMTSRHLQQASYRSSLDGNRHQQQQRLQTHSQTPAASQTQLQSAAFSYNSAPYFESSFGNGSVSGQKNDKLKAAREAREKLDHYRSFEADEDNEFYPHQQYNYYGSGASSAGSYKAPHSSDYFTASRLQQQQANSQLLFQSPLSTPERANFQTSLSSSRIHTANGFTGVDPFNPLHSPQRSNANIIYNSSTSSTNNRANLGRQQGGHLYYAPTNRSRY